MICLISGNYLEAKQWARGQLLEDNEWFYPTSEHELKRRINFHVLVIGTAGLNTTPYAFEQILSLAHARGGIGRV